MNARHAAVLEIAVGVTLLSYFALDYLQLRFSTWLGMPWLRDASIVLTWYGDFSLHNTTS